ncbi:NADPH-dependent F420 reductase [Microcella sp.]|uniref:NADPH-dependent F420 reductase n=1 Tax=Microcella sp. TaxID=1913979 RepID=UPI002564AD6B|nr:NAD(P)-binding domain-containing protein [Microcella sp.]MBX9472192.1 NAD(P)-binding domain-containing protein [Microcella sp.]
MTTTIGIIGSGNIGGTLAIALTRAGHEVVVANSRGPESLGAVVAELGDLASAGTVAEAAHAGEIVVVAVPLWALASIPSDLLEGRIVIDTNNYYPGRDGAIAELDARETTTSELVARHFAGARVVKAFNHIPAREILTHAQPAGSDGRRALAVYADDADARDRVAALIDEIGFDVVDGGALTDSWRIERDQPGYIPHFTVEQLRGKLAEAQR